MTVLTETFEGMPGGMNLAYPAQELDDTEARYIQDALVDKPGIIRRRGPVSAVSGIAAMTNKATGIVATLNPLGQWILGVLTGDNSNGYLSVLSNDYTTKTDLTWPFKLPNNPPSQPYYFYDAKPSLTGGTMIGVSSAYDSNSPNQGIAFWRGGNNANYTTGTLSVTRGSASVTGSGTNWASNVSPGMFLFANTDDPYTNAYIGIVLSVNSNTSITLGAVSPFACTAKSYTLQALRGLCPRVVKGRITCDTTSTIVTGATTKFISQSIGTGTWQLMRASDFAFIGKVTSVQTETSLTLTANASVACNNEAFVAIRVDGDFNIINTAVTQKVGFISAVYAERQWYANLGAQFQKTSRIWFSDPSDPEGIDLAPFDGDFIDIGSTTGATTPIKALMPAYNSLLIFKENETFAIYGNSPTTFEVKKLEDDGILCGSAVQPFGGGVIWAGHEGIHFFDGVQTENLVSTKLGDYYKSSIRSYDPSKYKIYSMMVRDHFWLFIENITPTTGLTKGNLTSVPSQYTICINMTTRAIVTHTNVNIRGAVQLPADAGQKTWYIVNDSTKGIICDSNLLFDSSGSDSFICDSPLELITNGNFEVDLTGWGTTGSSTITRDTTQFHLGTASMKVVANSAAGGAYIPTMISVSSNTSYAASTWVYSASGGSTIKIYWDEFTSGVVYTGTTPSTTVSLNAGWNLVKLTAITGSTTALIQFVITSPSVAQTFFVDEVHLMSGSSIPNLGPDFYVESKKFDGGDSLRKKRFEKLLIHYLTQGDSLTVDSVTGLNNIGQTSSTVLPSTSYTWDSFGTLFNSWNASATQYTSWDAISSIVFLPFRLRFWKRSQHFAFRIYQTSTSVSNVILGPYQIIYKLLRIGSI